MMMQRSEPGSSVMEAIISKGLQEHVEAKVGWRWQRCPHKGLSGYAAIAGSCRRILPDLSRLGCTKVEIVGVSMVLLKLERPGVESWSSLKGFRTSLGPRVKGCQLSQS